MKVTIRAKCSKQTFLKYASRSIECLQNGDEVYAFYDLKKDAYDDKYALNQNKIESEIIRGWNNWN